MKFILILAALFVSMNLFAQAEPCRRGCWTPGGQPTPAPQPHPHPTPTPPPTQYEYDCDIEMVDRYNQPIYIYTGTAETHAIACRIATQRCLEEVRLGYGGAGAKCWMIGKQ